LIKDALAGAPSGESVLVIDVGGTSVKILASGQSEIRSFLSGPTLTPGQMVARVKKLAGDWRYDTRSTGNLTASWPSRILVADAAPWRKMPTG
jgi:polyphosphate glucokinase